MTDPEIQALAERAAEAAVRKTLIGLGVDPHDPASVSDWHADRAFTRKARRGSEHGFKVVVGSIMTAVGLLIWLGFQSISGKQ